VHKIKNSGIFQFCARRSSLVSPEPVGQCLNLHDHQTTVLTTVSSYQCSA